MESAKRIMVLGAGVYQVPLIRKAREMGYDVTVVSIPGKYPGFAEADEALYMDTVDVDGILAAARERKISGIVTTGTDVAVRSIGHVCDALGLSGVSEKAAIIATDKTLMKQAFAEGGVSSSEFRIVHTLEEAIDAAREIGFPSVVKASDASGSRGISRVDSEDDIPAAFDAAMDATRKDRIIVEGFVSGYEIGVDGYVHEGKLVLFAPHTKFNRSIGPVTVPEGHAFPFVAEEHVVNEVRHQLELSIQAIGLDNCAVNGDFIISEDGSVHVIEVGGRCGATCIPELISIYFGIDYYEQMIRTSLGMPFEVPGAQRTPCMAKLIFSDATGTIAGIDRDGIDSIAARTDVVEVGLDVSVGDEVHAARNGTDRWGHVIMKTDDEELLNQVVREVAAQVTIV